MKDAKNFWLYAVGRLVSLTGSGVQNVAIPLFIFDLTGSGTMMGAFMIITTVPALIVYPVAGVIGDRVNRKQIMVSMDLARGAVIFFLALLAARNYMTIPILFGAQFLISLMNALFGPATLAMLPDIVEEEDLTRANSTLGAINSISFIVGPALGGILYGLGGIQAAFLINSVSFFGSGVAELFIRYQQKTRKLERVKEVISDLKEGLFFVKTHRGLLTLLVFGLVFNFLVNPIFSVLAPYVLRVVIQFSAAQFGIVQTSFMVGILIGNIIIGTLLARSSVENLLKRGLIVSVGFMFVFAFLIFPQGLELFGYASWALFFAISITYVLMGVSLAFVNTPLDVELQKLTPTAFRARVFSVMEVALQGIVPVGFGIIGIALDMVPAHAVAFTALLVILVVTLLFVLKYSKEVFKEFVPKDEKNVQSETPEK
jgi:MFS family permease